MLYLLMTVSFVRTAFRLAKDSWKKKLIPVDEIDSI